jgi:hypothetical protein
MHIHDNGKATDICVAYIGGGSRGWGVGTHGRPGARTGPERYGAAIRY